MWRLFFLLLRQHWRGDPSARVQRVSRVSRPRRAAFATGLLALCVMALALLGTWRGRTAPTPAAVEATATAEKATLLLRVTGVESQPLLVFLDRGDADDGQVRPLAGLRVQLTSINNAFEPAFQVAQLAARVEIGNADPVAHNTHLFDRRRRTLFNVALPQQGVPVLRVLGRTGLFEARCDLHAWMRAAVFVPPNAHYAVIREAGDFALRDIAPGRWRLHAWTAARGESVQAIDLAPGATRVLDLAGR